MAGDQFVQCGHFQLVMKMADREGFEPSQPESESVEEQFSCKTGDFRSSRPSSRSGGSNCPELAEIEAVWPKLSPEIQLAILAIARATGKGVVP